MTTKTELTARSRGKGGTIVTTTADLPPVFAGRTLVVKDLFDRVTFNKPGRVGIGPVDLGLAFGVSVESLTIVR